MSGDFHGRREDKRLVTGQGKYTSDWNFPDQVYAHFLRADRGHAEILGVEVSEALSSPGVIAVLTGADTTAAGFGPAPNMVKFPGKGGSKMKPVPREVMAHKKVVFVGQEVALVVAATAAQAQDAAEKIVVDYRDLTSVVDAEEALAPGAPVLYPELGDNLAFDFEYGDLAGTEAAFAKAAHVTKLVLDAPRIVGNPMEPKAALVMYDAGKDLYDVYSPSQGITGLRGGLSVGTGVPEANIRCHAHDVGGGFGIRGEAYTEYLTLMLAAKKVGKPVKWVASRTETFVSDHHGRGAKLYGELALDKDGNFAAMRCTWWINAGGYLSTPGAFTNTLAPSGNITNVYRIPVAHGLHRVVLTNTTPTTPYRGAARPNVSYLIERLVDEAALELGIDRVDLRRRNLISKDQFPFKTCTGATYDSGDPPGLLEDVLKHSNYAGFEKRRAASKANGKLRGISCCIFIEPSGGGSSPNEETFIKFGDSGNPVLYTVSGPSGQGHETVFPEIVGREFGIAPENITLRYSDPDGPALQGDGTIGSRSLMSHGGSLMLAAREVVKKGRDLAATHLEASVEDIEFTAGSYRVKGTDLSITLLDLARKNAGGDVNPLDTKYGLPAPRAFPTGAHVAEVEVDAATGDVELISYVGVDDCGNVINHALAEGQVHGGLMQGFGQVFDEVCLYDASGQMLTASFMDYCMPRAHELKGLKLYDRPVPSPSNPLGAKGVGEAGATGSVPTLTCAVLDALREVGVKHLDMPYTPSRVWGAIRDATRA
jgi:carbon-monoxide dehydrogenase large subunit